MSSNYAAAIDNFDKQNCVYCFEDTYLVNGKKLNRQNLREVNTYHNDNITLFYDRVETAGQPYIRTGGGPKTLWEKIKEWFS